jgi:hypothetical protein
MIDSHDAGVPVNSKHHGDYERPCGVPTAEGPCARAPGHGSGHHGGETGEAQALLDNLAATTERRLDALTADKPTLADIGHRLWELASKPSGRIYNITGPDDDVLAARLKLADAALEERRAWRVYDGGMNEDTWAMYVATRSARGRAADALIALLDANAADCTPSGA